MAEKFIVAKWQDGAVEVTPQSWIETDKRAGYWPSHIQERTTLTTAVQHKERPERGLWTKFVITKIYGTYDTYADAISKVKRMTSDKMLSISSSENESAAEDAKQRRTVDARKQKKNVELLEQPPKKMSRTKLKSPLQPPPHGSAVFQAPTPPQLLPLPSNAATPSLSSKMSTVASKEASRGTSTLNQQSPPSEIADKRNNNATITKPKRTEEVVKANNELKTLFCKSSDDGILTSGKSVTDMVEINFGRDSPSLSVTSEELEELVSNAKSVGSEGFRAWVIKSLSTLKVQNDIQTESLNTLKQMLASQGSMHQGSNDNAAGIGVNVLWDLFPLTTVKDVMSPDKRVRSEQGLKTKLVNLFATLGGKDLKSTVDLIMARVFAHSAAMEFSWQAGKGKQNFKNLIFFKIILAAVRFNPALAQATEVDVKSRVCYFMAHAEERFTREQKKLVATTFDSSSEEDTMTGYNNKDTDEEVTIDSDHVSSPRSVSMEKTNGEEEHNDMDNTLRVETIDVVESNQTNPSKS